MAGATTPRKRAPRKTATPASAKPPVVEGMSAEELAAEAERMQAELESDGGPVGPNGEIRPIQIGKRGRTPNQLVDLFELDGVMYQIPEHPSPMLIFRFMREARDKKIGRDVAVENLFVALLGKDALDALSESPEVTAEDIADVFTVIAHVAFGALKKIKAAADPS